MIFHRTREQHLERVAEKSLGVMLPAEERILFEDVAGLGAFDVRLETGQSVLASLLKHVVQYLEQFRVGLLRVRRGCEESRNGLDAADDDGQRIADQRGDEGGPANNDEFGPLQR